MEFGDAEVQVTANMSSARLQMLMNSPPSRIETNEDSVIRSSHNQEPTNGTCMCSEIHRQTEDEH